jgi:hypothetical protein
MIFSENRSHRVVASPPRTNILGIPISTPCNPLTSVLQENMFARLQNAKKCTSCGK